MSNIDRAAEVIRDEGWDGGDAAEHLAQALADAGLLAAHAPAAVAEVVRLRREIAAVRDRCLARAAVAPAAPVFNDLADALTRILEGDSHE